MPTISPKSIRTTRPTDVPAPRKRKTARKSKTRRTAVKMPSLRSFDWRRRLPVLQWGVAVLLFAGLGKSVV